MIKQVKRGTPPAVSKPTQTAPTANPAPADPPAAPKGWLHNRASGGSTARAYKGPSLNALAGVSYNAAPATVDRSFGTLDASASQSLTGLAKAFADSNVQGLLGAGATLTPADVASLATSGTLRGQSVATATPAVAADLTAAATFLNDPKNAAYLAQVSSGQGITAANVTSAQTAGFHDPHAAILKDLLGAFAAGAPAVSQTSGQSAEHAFTLAELNAMASSGQGPNGQPVATTIPDPATRAKFLDAVNLISQNPAVFKQLDLSGPGMAKMAMTDGKFTVTDLNRLIGANGQQPLPNRPAFENLVTATLAQVVPPFAQPVEIHNYPAAKRAELAKLYTQWADTTGMVAHHQAWHSANGSGGTQGPGSGEKFLQFHRQMEDEFKQWLLAQNPPHTDLLDKNGLFPTWDTMTPLPKEFWPGTQNHQINWKLPAFLTNTPQAGQTFTLDGRVITCLNDIHNPDELGRVWGESGAHAVAHNQLGGEMASFASVRDPAFLLWHFGVMETNRAEWMQTPSGQAWLQQHPSGWTDPNANPGQVTATQLSAVKATNPETPFWTADQIREAGVGFADPALRAEAAARVDA